MAIGTWISIHHVPFTDTTQSGAGPCSRSAEVCPCNSAFVRNPVLTRLAAGRYYRPAVKRVANPGPVNSLLGCDNPQGDSSAIEEPEGPPTDSQLLSHDPTLTAFAQLGAFRLNCERSFISLMDYDNQYILAEATRSVSLQSPEQCDEGDEVYLGPRVLVSWIWQPAPFKRNMRIC